MIGRGLKLQFLGMHNFGDLEMLKDVEVINHLRFTKVTGRNLNPHQ